MSMEQPLISPSSLLPPKHWSSGTPTSSVTKRQAAPTELLISRSFLGVRERATAVLIKLTTKHSRFGDYDYAWLCSPTLPFTISGSRAARRPPPFYGVDAELPRLLAMASGLQHPLAMLSGLITPPADHFREHAHVGCANISLHDICISHWLWHPQSCADVAHQTVERYLHELCNTEYSEWCLAMYSNGTLSAPYTPLLGWSLSVVSASLICSFLEIGLSFIPPRTLQRIFPPIVTSMCSMRKAIATADENTVSPGTAIVMIGASLIGSSAILDWGCASNGCQTRPPSGIYQLCQTIDSPHALPWGSPELISLDFLTFMSSILSELFGSPLLKNGSIIVSLAVGCIVAGAAGYMDGISVKSAPAITFLWHGPYIQDRSVPTCNFVSGFFLAIPNPVLGRVTTFLFASVVVSGLRVLAHVHYTRSDQFILAAAMSSASGICLNWPSSILSAGLVVITLNVILSHEMVHEEGEGDNDDIVEQDVDVEAVHAEHKV
ncbi:hypothetical protein ID866_7150 [Astraeus odoratus]|nr:hypothetical protein ID866_7150 [Astraeus odoratus]